MMLFCCFCSLSSPHQRVAMFQDIGGLDIQKQEVREAVELPLTHFQLYKQIGIDPPRGVRHGLCEDCFVRHASYVACVLSRC